MPKLPWKPGDDLLKRASFDSEEQIKERKDFEDSHDFKVGEEVYLTTHWIAGSSSLGTSRAVYADIKGKVERIKTDWKTGPCIRCRFGGTGLNIWNPNLDLIRPNEVTEALYG